jgi:dTDP-4-dehydrorhamnose 3,5-epimerase
MSTHSDARGRLFKANATTDRQFPPFQFNTHEHFFTESKENVFRGMHFQGNPHAVSKIISIVQGKVIDFLFDTREDSETYGNLQIVHLDGTEPASVFIPTGVAHGYLALEEKTIVSYRMDGPFCGKCDAGFSGKLVAEFLPIPFAKTIQSPRDATLINYYEYKYFTNCDG